MLMAKVKQGLVLLLVLTVLSLNGFSQSYPIIYKSIDTDTAFLTHFLSLKTSFPNRTEASKYISALVPLLQNKGYATASVDSVVIDSAKASIVLYLGQKYQYSNIQTSALDEEILQAIRFPTGRIDMTSFPLWQQKILDWLEENGHPFGKVYLENITIQGNDIDARIKIDKGPIYKIDSIRVYGDVNLKNEFLQKYLEIPAGSSYNKKKLSEISKKIAGLNYLSEDRPSDITMLGTGSVLNLYLRQKKSNQVNALVGFIPTTDVYLKRKLVVAIDANVMLRNALGSGETMSLVWQQLQQSSPRLNLLYQQPYAFHSQFGIDFAFDMYKQDTAYLNVNMRLGTSYKLGANRSASVFLLRRQTIVSGINSAAIIQSKKLPAEIDVNSINLGVTYEINTTDYRLNPRKGIEFTITSSAGTKSIRKNNLVLELKDPYNPSFKFESLYDTLKQNAYQLRIQGLVSQYFTLGKQSTIKLAMQGAIYQSASYFRNELFQVGGYKLMRGFDEESQYVSQYAIGTLEYRYLIGLNSAFFAFFDGGAGKHLLETTKYHQYLGTGLGLSFETKAGIIQLAWAVGKRDDVAWNLKQSKIHVGFVSYF
jgi:outer membrane protein assembly factor BamA